MGALWSYRALLDGDRWRWQLLRGGVVILQGNAATHTDAITQVAEALQRLQAAAPLT
jgi:hypothetical protein